MDLPRGKEKVNKSGIKRQDSEARVMIVLGIINQLLTTRYSRVFKGLPLNQSQFGVLNHFTHTPDKSWLVSDLANVMEINQPGITKIVAVLIDKGLLASTTGQGDKRKRNLKITKKGLSVCEKMVQSLLPDISLTLSDWSNRDLTHFQSDLEKLMGWLDENRIA
ncbi:MAG: MarR family transcriptional regulator [Pseudomonadales bacterium]|nr:MarR family transcriptional regulator [Pseudomonadales bacterium]